MKRIDGWLTLSFSGLCVLFLVLSFLCLLDHTANLLPLVAAAICWGAGFAWFARLGRLARGTKRRLYAVAFCMLCICLLLCLVLCGFFVFF